MIITCPRCFATYNVPDAAMGKERTVRCSSCRYEWTESPMPVEAIAGLAPEPEAHLDPAPAFIAPDPVEVPVVQPEPVAATPAVAKPMFKAPPPRVAKKQPTGAAAWAVFAVATVACLLVLFREPLGHRSIFLTDMYETIGLPIEGPNEWFRFEGVQLEKSEAAGRTVFNIHGVIVNQSRRIRAVPPLKLYWRATSGTIGPMLVITAENQDLIVGAKTSFFGELKNVDASSGGEVKVTFLNAKEAGVLKPGEVADPAFTPAHPPAAAAPAHAPAPVVHDEPTPAVHDEPAPAVPSQATPSAPETEHDTAPAAPPPAGHE